MNYRKSKKGEWTLNEKTSDKRVDESHENDQREQKRNLSNKVIKDLAVPVKDQSNFSKWTKT